VSDVQVATQQLGRYRGLKTSRARLQEASKSQELRLARIIEHVSSPLLHAANMGSLANLTWLLSDAPLECYEQFATDHCRDPRVRRISQCSAGFRGTVKQFLDSGSKLAILSCVMSKSGYEGLEILAHLINVMPDAVDARSSAGDTPLLMTFRFQNLEAAEMLIKAGANQMACDNDGGNVLHSLFYFSVDSGSNNTSSHVPEVVSEKHYAHMRAMINLLNPKLLPDMCTQQHHRRDHFSHAFGILVLHGQ
jgi:hypothetical protein